jgi:hypothetical protein
VLLYLPSQKTAGGILLPKPPPKTNSDAHFGTVSSSKARGRPLNLLNFISSLEPLSCDVTLGNIKGLIGAAEAAAKAACWMCPCYTSLYGPILHVVHVSARRRGYSTALRAFKDKVVEGSQCCAVPSASIPMGEGLARKQAVEPHQMDSAAYKTKGDQSRIHLGPSISCSANP